MKSLLSIVVGSIVLAGCSLFAGDDGPADLSAEELRSAPESVKVGGVEVALRTYMWRDFMPISPPNGKPLIAVFTVYSMDSTDLPVGLKAEAAWVVRGNDVWSSFLDDGSPGPQKSFEFEHVARDGPKWGPNIEVDAVVRLREVDGKTHLLRASRQVIERTD